MKKRFVELFVWNNLEERPATPEEAKENVSIRPIMNGSGKYIILASEGYSVSLEELDDAN